MRIVWKIAIGVALGNVLTAAAFAILLRLFAPVLFPQPAPVLVPAAAALDPGPDTLADPETAAVNALDLGCDANASMPVDGC